MSSTPAARIAIIGGGPAGLMAAETARAAGAAVDVYEGQGSVGRKFLLAGKGGLNLTHSEALARFVDRYGARRSEVGRWLAELGPEDLRAWARGLNVETFVGTSGRIFPTDLKAAPLLRRWVRRLRERGVRFHAHHYCVGIDGGTSVRCRTAAGERIFAADAIVLAMGGASWPELGSDGHWTTWLHADIAPLQPANCGFDVAWSPLFSQRYAGHPVKSVVVSARNAAGDERELQGEFVITAGGVEGSVIYAHSAALRDTIGREGAAEIRLDLTPGRDRERLQLDLSKPRRGRSLTEHLRRCAGIEGVKAGLIYEAVPENVRNDPAALAAAIKSLPLKLLCARPIAEAISTAGGVRFAGLDDSLMIRSLPGVFCAGEMIDWEAPTGGYLLTACFASGRIAARGASSWLAARGRI